MKVTNRDAIHANPFSVACSWWSAGHNWHFVCTSVLTLEVDVWKIR